MGRTRHIRLFAEKFTTARSLERSPCETNLLKTGGEGLDLVLVFFFALVGLRVLWKFVQVTMIGRIDKK